VATLALADTGPTDADTCTTVVVGEGGGFVVVVALGRVVVVALVVVVATTLTLCASVVVVLIVVVVVELHDVDEPGNGSMNPASSRISSPALPVVNGHARLTASAPLRMSDAAVAASGLPSAPKPQPATGQ